MKKLFYFTSILIIVLNYILPTQVNAAIRNFKVEQSDLTIPKITAEQIGQTQDFKYTITIQNSGKELKSLSGIMFELEFMQGKFSGITRSTRPTIKVPVSSLTNKLKLAPAESLDVSVNGNPRTKNFATEEKVRINAEIDSTNVVLESNEDNNTNSIEIKPLSSNLAIESVNFTDQKTIQIAVKNRGNLTAALSDQKGSVYLRYSWIKEDGRSENGGSLTLASLGSGSLGIGGVITASVPFAPSVDARNLDVDISFSTTDILDSNSSDDRQLVPLPGIMPDLKLEEFGKYNAGDSSFSQSIMLNNIGKGSLAANRSSELFMEYVMLDKDSNPIGTSKKQIVNLTSSIEPGRGRISTYGFEPIKDVAKMRFTIDPENKIKEIDEGNNSLEIAVAVPDIAIESVSYAGKGNATYVIRNVSQSAFSGPVGGTYSFFTGSDSEPVNTLPEENISLAPGATEQKTISNPFYVPGGGNKSFQITVTTSALESTKDNNTAKIFILDLQLPPEKLVVQDEAAVLSEITGVKQKSLPSIIKKDSQNAISSLGEDVGLGVGDFVNGAQIAIATNPEEKINMQTANAKEKILQANSFIDQGKNKKAIGRLKSYEKSVAGIAETAKKDDQEQPQPVEKAAIVSLEDQVQQQLLFAKFNRIASSEEDKDIEKVQAKVLADIGETAAAIDDPRRVSDAVEKGLVREDGVLSAVHDAEILRKLEENVPQEHKKVIDELKEENADEIKLQLAGLKGDYKNYISDYIELSGFDEEVAKETIQDEAGIEIDIDDKQDNDYSEFSDEREEQQEDESESEEGRDPRDSGVQVTSGCPDIDDPVCGADELNYTNECEAKDNNVEVAYKGECIEKSYNTGEDNEEESESEPEKEVEGANTSKFALPKWWPFQ